ncbi:hypothetical protein OAA32_00095 [bacterium]|jgi:hypothetical protein|nr:hypothetical protein [bacterium]
MTQQIELNIKEMRKMKIFIATPMYGGMCNGIYTKSLVETVSQLQNQGIPSQLYYLFNESLITRARNYCVHNFLKSDATHLVFIDSDIGWSSMDFMYMLHLMSENPDKLRVFCGLYPKKAIAWEKVLKAAKTGQFDETPWELEQVAGDIAFNPRAADYPDGVAPVYEPIKIKEGATGFMFIERSVFEEYAEAYPELLYTPDHLREGEFRLGEQITAFFDCIINEESRYLSEDYMFSEYCTKLGIDIWALPLVELMHCGAHIFRGSLVKMAQADVHATMAAEDIGKIQSRHNDLRQDKNSS